MWLEEWLPPIFFEGEFLEVAIWKWLSLVVLLGSALFAALLIAGGLPD